MENSQLNLKPLKFSWMHDCDKSVCVCVCLPHSTTIFFPFLLPSNKAAT